MLRAHIAAHCTVGHMQIVAQHEPSAKANLQCPTMRLRTLAHRSVCSVYRSPVISVSAGSARYFLIVLTA